MDATVIAELAKALGTGEVLLGEDIPARNRSDWSGLAAVLPLACVRPRNTAEVSAILKLCHRLKLPLVPQGGLTGLCGGGRPVADGIAVSLERMSGVEEIDAAMATMTVRAGTPLEVVQRAADEAGFLCPLDLGARGSASIGGNLSTNAGGNRVIRYGMAREMVLGLEVVLADGTIVSNMNKLMKNNAGYDLKQLFLGSEGTLGIITRAVLRLWPKPSTVSAAFIGLADFKKVVRLLDESRRGLGATLSAFEVLSANFYDYITGHVPGIRTPLQGRHERYVLLELQGSDERFDGPRFDSFLERMLEEGIIEDAAVAQSEGDIKAFWQIRDSVSEWGHIIGPHFGYDVGLPIQAAEAFMESCRKALVASWPDVITMFFGHLGDSNMHIVVAVPGMDPQPYDAGTRIVYDQVRAHGGTISAEHGIGTLKKPYFGYARSEAEIALMAKVKAALDPLGILNPGKVVDRTG